jgi:hypothetical protein
LFRVIAANTVQTGFNEIRIVQSKTKEQK